MPCRQASADRPSLAIDIATLIAAEEKSHPSDFIGDSPTLQRVQLPNLTLRAALPRAVKHRLRHACLDQTGADGVDADPRASQLECAGLCN